MNLKRLNLNVELSNEMQMKQPDELKLWTGLTEQVRMNKQPSGNNLTLRH